MIDCFNIHQFFSDGDAPESGTAQSSRLSERWLSLCGSLLDHFGPVFNEDLGSTLSHFRIRMAGPCGELLAYDHVHYVFAMLLGQDSSQDQSSRDWFAKILDEAAASQGNSVSPKAQQILHISPQLPSLLLFDHARTDLDEVQKLALLQLGIHLAAAYFRWSDHNASTLKRG